jgi:hypothetical protein
VVALEPPPAAGIGGASSPIRGHAIELPPCTGWDGSNQAENTQWHCRPGTCIGVSSIADIRYQLLFEPSSEQRAAQTQTPNWNGREAVIRHKAAPRSASHLLVVSYS